MATMKFAVEGMSCEHCVSRIRNALSEAGAVLVGSDLAKKEIEVDPGNADLPLIIDTISDLGFEARKL